MLLTSLSELLPDLYEAVLFFFSETLVVLLFPSDELSSSESNSFLRSVILFLKFNYYSGKNPLKKAENVRILNISIINN